MASGVGGAGVEEERESKQLSKGNVTYMMLKGCKQPMQFPWHHQIAPYSSIRSRAGGDRVILICFSHPVYNFLSLPLGYFFFSIQGCAKWDPLPATPTFGYFFDKS